LFDFAGTTFFLFAEEGLGVVLILFVGCLVDSFF
jgi:hypothetical protein